MSEQQKNSQDFLTEFIELYKSLPCLWKIRCKEYSNRKKKSKAYELIINKYREYGKEVGRDVVVKKINALRSCYRKEKKKVLESLAENQEYKPKLWYYDLLTFLDDNDNEKVAHSYPQSPENIAIEIYDELSNTERPSSTRSSCSNETECSLRKSKKRSIPLKMDPFEVITPDSLHETHVPTQFDYAAKGWAITLNLLPNDQKLFASRIINEVLFQAQMGNLNSDTQLTNLQQNFGNKERRKTANCSQHNSHLYQNFGNNQKKTT